MVSGLFNAPIPLAVAGQGIELNLILGFLADQNIQMVLNGVPQ